MNQLDLIRKIALDSGESQAAVKRVLDAFTSTVREVTLNDGSVRLTGLGTFSTKWRKPSVIRDIQSSRKRLVGGRHVVVFRPAADFKREQQERTDQAWKNPAHQEAWRLARTLVDDVDLYHGDTSPTLSGDMSPNEIRKRCQLALGDPWRRAQRTFDRQVDESITATHDYLARAAAQLWSA